jgi:hypothetical protein
MKIPVLVLGRAAFVPTRGLAAIQIADSRSEFSCTQDLNNWNDSYFDGHESGCERVRFERDADRNALATDDPASANERCVGRRRRVFVTQIHSHPVSSALSLRELSL